MLEVTDKDFKVANVTMLKYIKDNMLIMNEKIRNISRNRNYVFKWNSKTDNIISVTKMYELIIKMEMTGNYQLTWR